ncbi:bifunctional diguanylate cyclase/phosphodiesterase [Methylobacter sp.]|uniref:bifunctional diguanylate cyclase/phosphodiesterase n=1 Tax=Methylobacter sp. TaxID=2051955 RepID=UPI002FDD56E4
MATCWIGAVGLVDGRERYAFAVFLGALVVNVITINSFWVAVAIAASNTLEALLGALLLKRYDISDQPALSTHNYLRLLIAGGIASVTAALLGTAILSFSGFLNGEDFFNSLAYWWMGDTLGIALMAPLILVWRRAPDGGFDSKRLVEFILLISLAFLISQVIFFDWMHDSVGHIAKGYWMFLIITWVAACLEAHGVVIILVMSAGMGLLGVQKGIGYFARDLAQSYPLAGLNISLVNYWFYIVILSVTGMTLATYFVARRRVEQTLTVSEGYQRAIFNATPDAMLISDAHGIITQVNRQAELMLGYKLGELVGQSIEVLVPESFRSKHPELHAKYVGAPVARPLGAGRTVQARRKDGSHFDVDISVSPIKTEQGLLFASALRDVTLRKQADAHLRVAAIAFESNEPMVITDADNFILQVNRAFTKSTGYTKEEAVGRKINLLKSGRHGEAFYAAMWETIKRTGTWQGEVWDRRKNGEIYPKWLIISVVKGDDGAVTHYVGTHIDITERKAAEEQIKQLAFYDPLTRLPNRRLLQERLKHGIDVERRDGKQLALLMLDLDRFKSVNDSLGHMAGDELLQQVAVRITTRLRDVDMVARLGGDEFIVLLEDIAHPEDAARVAENIISDLSKPFGVEQGEDIQIGVSIGISLYPQHGENPELLMDHADAALYQAKDAGRGCFAYFSEDLTIAARERIALESRLRKAIEQQDLRVFYQPQVDIASGRIIGAEALVRWLDPVEGLIPPVRFIPIAEETGLILVIGEWVLRETCRQGRQWLDAGLPPLTLAVNVSPQQFRRSDICGLVATVLKNTGFPSNQLELEITESGLMENQGNAPEILNCLRAQGIRLAIDDFGTGYSSLACLKHFPLDLLKIDKSFIDDIPHLQDDMEIASTIIAMGHILGFKVLAEGVETIEQLAFLQEKGCDMYQGYIKSRPIPAEEFVELLRNQQQHEMSETWADS